MRSARQRTAQDGTPPDLGHERAAAPQLASYARRPLDRRERSVSHADGTTPTAPEAIHAAIIGAYWRGRLDERQFLADRSTALDAVWLPPARMTWEQQVAARVALFDACAERDHAGWGTTELPAPTKLRSVA